MAAEWLDLIWWSSPGRILCISSHLPPILSSRGVPRKPRYQDVRWSRICFPADYWRRSALGFIKLRGSGAGHYQVRWQAVHVYTERFSVTKEPKWKRTEYCQLGVWLSAKEDRQRREDFCPMEWSQTYLSRKGKRGRRSIGPQEY